MIGRYRALVDDHGKEHVPNAQCIVVFKYDPHASGRRKIVRICKKEDLRNVSARNFRVLDRELCMSRFLGFMELAVKMRAYVIDGSCSKPEN